MTTETVVFLSGIFLIYLQKVISIKLKIRLNIAVIFLFLFTSLSYAQERNLFYGHVSSVNQKENSIPVCFYKCPKCDNIISRPGSSSPNTSGAKMYSDGKITGPLYKERPEVAICEKCRYPFWMKDDFADTSCFQSHLFTTSENGVLYISQKAAFYGPETYDRLLINHVYCSRDEEKYLLTRYWWALNDMVRTKMTFLTDPCNNDTARTNLERLIKILEEENDELTVIPEDINGGIPAGNKLMLTGLRTVTEILDHIKNTYPFTISISGSFRETIHALNVNILRTLKSLNNKDLNTINRNYLTMAEIHRNLGRFEKCLEELSYIETDNKFIKYMVPFIQELCENKIRLVSGI